jgi:hypothetical protein
MGWKKIANLPPSSGLKVAFGNLPAIADDPT